MVEDWTSLSSINALYSAVYLIFPECHINSKKLVFFLYKKKVKYKTYQRGAESKW